MKRHMRTLILTLLLLLLPTAVRTQGTVPTFRVRVGHVSYALAGRGPAQGGIFNIPTLLVSAQLVCSTRRRWPASRWSWMPHPTCVRSTLADLLEFRISGQAADPVRRRSAPYHAPR